MSRKSFIGTLTAVLAVLAPGAAMATVSGPTKSPLLGYPRFRGVMLVHDGSSQTAARERAISSALKAASSTTTPDCRTEVNPGADLCYWGGPVVRAHKVHLIFWEGTALQAHPIGAAYSEAIERYFERVAAASGAASNAYAVSTQYAGSNGAGEYNVAFGGPSIDVNIDKNPLPVAGTTASRCEDPATPNGICITDKDLKTQIELVRTAENLSGHHWESSLSDIYFVFTPSKVGSCFFGEGESSEGNACAFAGGGYCAYHSSFENASKEPAPPLYANLPDTGNVPGCDSFEHPNEAEGADATLDATSHEHNETITDPLASSWFDVIGQEVGDKCLPPETFDIYGGTFGGVPATENEKKEIVPGTLYNQIIGSGHYYLQREWSNTAFNGEGGCVARMFHTEFAPPSAAKATVPAAFDGSASGEEGDRAVYWVWSFGDGMQVGTPEPIVAHAYATPGAREVTLTAFDRYGNSNTHTTIVEVGAAPAPLAPPAPLTIKEVVREAIAPGRLLSAQVAEKLGLPANGKKLTGGGPLSLGRAECPPACGVTLQLYAKVTTTSHKRRTTKLVLVGTAHLTVAVKALKTLSLSLSAKGKALLRKLHKLSCKLIVTVEGQEGGTWQIVRSLTLRR
jgi:hypothetical protein